MRLLPVRNPFCISARNRPDLLSIDIEFQPISLRRREQRSQLR